jgi:hypothetical protein
LTRLAAAVAAGVAALLLGSCGGGGGGKVQRIDTLQQCLKRNCFSGSF